MATEAREKIAEIISGNQMLNPHIVSNHTGYGYAGSENFEHDNSGDSMNFSGVEDDINDAVSEHEGWQAGYDY